MKCIYFFLVPLSILVFVSCTNGSKQRNEIVIPEGYQLVWNDEFDYQGLPDSTKWSFDVEGNAWKWGNNEAQYYTSKRIENAHVKNGILSITAIKENIEGRNYSSARLTTKYKGDWLYGRFEINAKLPEGRGLWPAIWMLPTENTYGGWPKSGEIDIMENVGFAPDTIWGSVHTENYNHMIQTQKSDTIIISDCYSAFHTYAVEWNEDEIKFFVDDEKFGTFKNEYTSSGAWPFDKPFHILLNVAVGGNWGGMKGIDESIFPRSMGIDYVRVWQKIEN